MGRDHREQLAELLADLRSAGSFATRCTAPPGDLAIEVRGVGALRLPVTAAQAKQLRLIARPAAYGQGEDTVVDRRVRDTWEIPRSRVRIDKRRWNSTLGPILDTVCNDLGLAGTARLRAELHSMLVYEPGQFFAAHQDSEKSDAMIGSLVVLLPSKSTGGDLVIEHRGQSVRYQGSASSLVFVAFYSDTRHEVLPVERGYRVALTYNLMLAGDSNAARFDANLAAAAADLLARHFADAAEPRWRGDLRALEPPDRLVFLLDHQYTERGLQWSQLKGDDAPRGAVLTQAAELAGCDLGLAHAEIQETWDCYEDMPPRPGRTRYWDDEPATGTDGFEPGELLDACVQISAVHGVAVKFDPDVHDEELAAVTPTAELTPYDSDYTGYMGNYGNTMDRWYRRAAIVIWPRSRAFALQAKADPVAAAHHILATTDTNPDQASGMVATLLRFWSDSTRNVDQRTLLPLGLQLAYKLADEPLATRLLEPFAVVALGPDDAAVFLALAEQHDLDWLGRQITTWSRSMRRAGGATPDHAAWVTALPDLCTALLNDPHADDRLRKGSAQILTEVAWTWLNDALNDTAAIPAPSRRDSSLADLAAPLLGVLRSAFIVDAPGIRDAALHVIGPRNDEFAATLAGVAAAAKDLSATDRRQMGILTLAQALRTAAENALARPERPAGDWSITRFERAGCCQDCTRLATFLRDPHEQQLTWPLAKPRRQHIHHRIDEAELPVTHRTQRQGSPHKLVLTKTDDLFRHDTDRRQAARAWLAAAQLHLHTATETPTALPDH